MKRKETAFDKFVETANMWHCCIDTQPLKVAII